MTVQFCGDCGAPRRGPEQRFCLECGSSLSEAAPTAPLAAAAPPPYAPAPPAYDAPPAWSPAGTGQPEYAVPEATSHRGPRLGKVLGIGALVLALGGAGVIGWQVFGPKGGADSPEDAVREFVTGVVEQDGVALIDVVAPGEVEGVGDLYESAHDRLEDEGIVSGDSVTDAVTIEVDDLELEVDELGDNAARVSLTGGTYTVSYDPSKLSDRLDFVADEEPEGDSASGDLAEALEAYDEPFAVSTVQVDGRWYVTLLGTAMDVINTELEYYDEDYRSPDFDVLDDDLEPIVGDDPEEVVDNLVDAVNSGDVDDVLANLPAGLVVGLRPYATTLNDILRTNGVSVQATASGLDLSTEDLGDDQLKVTIESGSFTAEASADGDYVSGTFDVDDDCFYATGTDYYDDYPEEENGCISDVSELGDVGIDSFYVVMREVDGGYQLDPVATAVAYATEAIEEIPSSLIDDALADIENDF